MFHLYYNCFQTLIQVSLGKMLFGNKLYHKQKTKCITPYHIKIECSYKGVSFMCIDFSGKSYRLYCVLGTSKSPKLVV